MLKFMLKVYLSDNYVPLYVLLVLDALLIVENVVLYSQRHAYSWTFIGIQVEYCCQQSRIHLEEPYKFESASE